MKRKGLRLDRIDQINNYFNLIDVLLKLISQISAQDRKYRSGAQYLKYVYGQESMSIMIEFTES